jgi:hypothetical protein
MKIISKCFALLAAIVAVASATPASAQATRTWVSGVGDDVNPCSRTAPCKTFAGAISKTATGGEINCLDPGGFGQVTITKSITIDCRGTHGSILAANVNGVIVNGTGISVTLRNLTINGANTTTGNGVRILAAAEVNIENLVIENFAGTSTNGRGVAIESSAANTRVTIRDTEFYNVEFIAVHSNPTAGNVILDLDHVSASGGSGTAVQLRQNTAASIDDCSFTNNINGGGVVAELTTVTAIISNSVLSNNGTGVFAGNGGAPTIRLYGNVITGNPNNGIFLNGGNVISAGNNLIHNNGGNQTPSSTVSPT